MSDSKTIGRRWEEFRPSKTTWFWSCVGTAVATIIVGFGFGGWVTGGTASSMAINAADQSRMELAANICVERFTHSPDFGAQLASLKEASRYQRDDILDKAGWTTLGGLDKPIKGAAEACAVKLVAMEAPVTLQDASATVTDEPTTIQ